MDVSEERVAKPEETSPPVFVPTPLDEAWSTAIFRRPLDWFGPRVEPRWPNRWRAWYEHNKTRETIDAWGATEADALVALAEL